MANEMGDFERARSDAIAARGGAEALHMSEVAAHARALADELDLR